MPPRHSDICTATETDLFIKRFPKNIYIKSVDGMQEIHDKITVDIFIAECTIGMVGGLPCAKASKRYFTITAEIHARSLVNFYAQ